MLYHIQNIYFNYYASFHTFAFFSFNRSMNLFSMFRTSFDLFSSSFSAVAGSASKSNNKSKCLIGILFHKTPLYLFPGSTVYRNERIVLFISSECA